MSNPFIYVGLPWLVFLALILWLMRSGIKEKQKYLENKRKIEALPEEEQEAEEWLQKKHVPPFTSVSLIEEEGRYRLATLLAGYYVEMRRPMKEGIDSQAFIDGLTKELIRNLQRNVAEDKKKLKEKGWQS